MAQMNKYIFPNILATAMSKIDTRTQLEASMLSMTLMLGGLIVTGFYLALYAALPLWYKVILVINILAGIVFMSSFVITTFQSYQTHCEILDFQKEMKGGNDKNAEN